jgi:phosphate starvation-inducible membrane PsiE
VSEHPHSSRAANFLKNTESIVLFVLAIVLVVLAIMILVSGVIGLYQAVVAGQVREQAIDILDGILLVMMIMEIVYTVTLSMEAHTLVAEPFLIVGAIAAIRRMLVITAEGTKLELSNPAAFQNTLVELGLLAATILMIAGAIYIMRRSQKFIEPEHKQ